MSENTFNRVAEEHELLAARKRLRQIHHVTVRDVIVDESVEWAPGIKIALDSREMSVLTALSGVFDRHGLEVAGVSGERSKIVKLSSTLSADVTAI